MFIGTGLAAAFIVSLRKAMHNIDVNVGVVEEMNFKLTLKITILTAVAVFSTVISLFLTAATLFAFVLFSWDTWINVLCVLLMAPYYSSKYFDRLCCFCICCYKRCVTAPAGLSLFESSNDKSKSQGKGSRTRTKSKTHSTRLDTMSVSMDNQSSI